MGINLMGEQGWADFRGARSSPQDFAVLIIELMRRYASLGELLSSTGRSTDGPTSKTTSGSSTLAATSPRAV